MILVDANLLVYAIDRDSAHHDKAHAWVEQILSDTTPVGLAWIVVLGIPENHDPRAAHAEPVVSRACRSPIVDSWLAIAARISRASRRAALADSAQPYSSQRNRRKSHFGRSSRGARDRTRLHDLHGRSVISKDSPVSGSSIRCVDLTPAPAGTPSPEPARRTGIPALPRIPARAGTRAGGRSPRLRR